jgi:hypothetical protein
MSMRAGRLRKERNEAWIRSRALSRIEDEIQIMNQMLREAWEVGESYDIHKRYDEIKKERKL